MDKVEVKFGDWIQKGFDVFKENPVVLIVAGLLAWLLSGITFGILAGPMMVGLILIVLRLVDRTDPKPEIGDVFKGFSYFAQAFLFVLVWSAILLGAWIVLIVLTPLLGCLAGLLFPVFGLAVLALGCLLMFALFLIADRNMDFWPASMESMSMVKSNFWPFLGFFFVASLIGGIGSVLCGVGAIITMPLFYCILGVAYREVFAAGSPAPAAAAPAPQEAGGAEGDAGAGPSGAET